VVPVSFTASASGESTITLKLAKPSKQPLTLTVKIGDPAVNGQTLGANVTVNLP
jgi:hypothetical protein